MMDELMENNKMDELIAVIDPKPRKTRYTLFIVKEAHFHFVLLSSQQIRHCVSELLAEGSFYCPCPEWGSLAPSFGVWKTEAQSQLCHYTAGNTRQKEGFCSRD